MTNDELIQENKRLKEQVRELDARNALYFEALEDIKSIKWGYDGDCGAIAIIDKVL